MNSAVPNVDLNKALSLAMSQERRTPNPCVALLLHPSGESKDKEESPFAFAVPKPKGSAFLTIGRQCRGELHLSPMEGLYLAEKGLLNVFLEDSLTANLPTPLSIQEVYSSLVFSHPRTFSLSKYRIYAYLKGLGYIVYSFTEIQSSFTRRVSTSGPAKSQGLLGWTIHFFCIAKEVSWLQNLVSIFLKLTYSSNDDTPRALPKGIKMDTDRILCVYPSIPGFKKSEPGRPVLNVWVFNASEPVPSVEEMQYFEMRRAQHSNDREMCSFIENKLAIVEGSQFTFLSV